MKKFNNTFFFKGLTGLACLLLVYALIGSEQLCSADAAFAPLSASAALADKTPISSADGDLNSDYLLAVDLMENEEYADALALFTELGDYADSLELAIQCRAGIYESAKLAMINTEFEYAAELFRLIGSYEDSERQLANCEERIAAEAEYTGRELITPEHVLDDFKNGKLYGHSLGYIFVPDEINAETAWLVYYPGGHGTGDNLSVPCIYLEHKLFRPNAVMIYLYNNGWWDMRDFSLEVGELMKQLALECDIWFHDVVTVGSSNGSYASMIAVPVLYEQEGISVDAVLAFDAGCEWDTNYVGDAAVLDAAECDSAAKANTRFYLFEQRNFSEYFMDVPPVALMVEHGVDVVLVECDNDGHNHIGPDAIRAGFYDFAMGQKDTLETVNATGNIYSIRLIKVYPDGTLENIEVPYSLPLEEARELLTHGPIIR